MPCSEERGAAVKPLAIDLYCGLGGWYEGLISEGFDVIGFDITRHQYGDAKYPGHLVIQDVLTLHGSQFKDAAVIVASPPCQNYSYLAMPWSRSTSNNSQKAKALRRKWETEGPDNRLFDACFRIQREAIEATGTVCLECAGSGVYERRVAYSDKVDEKCMACDGIGATNTRYIPLIVENVRGANEWVSPKSRYNYGSFHLWGDVPAIMPISRGTPPKRAMDDLKYGKRKLLHEHLPVGTGPLGRNAAGEGVKVASADGGRRTDVSKGAWFTSRDCGVEGTKVGGDWFRDPACHSKHGSRSSARKAASAQIAKIPFPLSEHIARVFKPR